MLCTSAHGSTKATTHTHQLPTYTGSRLRESHSRSSSLASESIVASRSAFHLLCASKNTTTHRTQKPHTSVADSEKPHSPVKAKRFDPTVVNRVRDGMNRPVNRHWAEKTHTYAYTEQCGRIRIYGRHNCVLLPLTCFKLLLVHASHTKLRARWRFSLSTTAASMQWRTGLECRSLLVPGFETKGA